MSRKPRKKKKKKHSGTKKYNVEKEFVKAYRLHTQGNIEKAEEKYRYLILKTPDHSDALNLLGTIVLEKREYDEAEVLFKKAILSHPKAANYHNNLGTLYRLNGFPEKARQSYGDALKLDPAYAEVHNNLGIVHKDYNELTEAVSCFRQALKNKTEFSEAYYNLGTVYCEQGRIEESVEAYKSALKINAGFSDAYSNLLYTLHYSDLYSPKDIFLEHQKWAGHFTKSHPDSVIRYANEKNKQKKIRIGYVSPDFCTHSVSFFLENVLGFHNRNKFEIFCFSNTPKSDSVTSRLKGMTDHWFEISGVSDIHTADIIRSEKIDILIDLAGHTRNNRIHLFALKPAPIQATWLGYPDTTGLSTIDYRFTDNFADPPGESDEFHTEKLYRLPDSFLCYKPPGESMPVSDPPLLKNGYITFGSFNNGSKISTTTVKLWSEILKNVPGSQLMIKARSFSDPGTRNFLLSLFEKEGILSERISFAGFTASLTDHLQLYHSIDIALDTFPYHGTTTTCEALWMGVPVVTLKGNAHVSRVGVSILTNTGIPDLIGESFDEYIQNAVTLACHHDRLKLLRSELRNKLLHSILTDAKTLTADLESALTTMWNSWCDSESGDIKTFTDTNGKTFHLNEHVVNSEIFENNINQLEKCHPSVVSLLDEPAPFAFDVKLSSNGIPNLVVSEKGEGDNYYLYPETDPLSDLPGLLEKIKGIRGKVICVMGAALCLHAEHILRKIGDYNLVVLFEAVPSIFKTAMLTMDLVHVISHPNIRLAIGQNANPYDLFKRDDDKLYTSNGGEFVEYNKAVILGSDWYTEKRNQFNKYFTKRMISRLSAGHAGKGLLKNSFKNLSAMMDSRPLNILKDVFNNKPAIIVASGPSLSLNIHKIKEIQDRAIIIAADSAVAPLLNNGIKPHFIASVDYNDFTYEKLSPFISEIQETSLIYIPNVTSKISKYINFSSKYYSYSDIYFQGLFNRLLGEKADCLEDAHSVIHLATAAAQVFGCDPIIFTGLDLAFSSNKDHAKGTILHWGNNRTPGDHDVMVESIYGEMIPSHPGFVGMIEICERIISVVPGRRYIDASEGGAKINGTEIMLLSDVIIDLPDDEIVFPELSNQVKNVERTDQVIGNLQLLLKDVQKCMDSLNHYFEESSKVLKFVKNQGGLKGFPESLPTNLKQSIHLLDKINVNLESDKTIFYLQMLLSKSFDEYFAYEMTLKESESASDAGRHFINGLNQQKFVQEIRFEALLVLKRRIDEQIMLFSELHNIKKAVEINYDFEVDKLKLAQFYYQYDLLNKAELILSTISDNPKTVYYLGCIKIKQGNVKEGLDILKNIASKNQKIEKDVDNFIKNISNEWIHSKGPITVQRILTDRVLMINPMHKEANAKVEKFRDDDLLGKTGIFLKQAEEYHKMNDVDSALRILTETTDIYQSLKSDWYELQARCLIETGQLDEGFCKLNEAVILDSNKAVLWEEIGDVLSNEKNYEVSVEMYEKCMIALPDRFDVLRKIGDSYMMNKNIEAAIIAYEMVLSKNPENIEAVKNLSVAKKMLSQK